MSASELTLVFSVVALAAAVQGSIGFGFAIAAAPVLMLVDASLVPGPLLVCGLPLTAAILFREHAHLELRSVAWALSGNALGTAAAAWVLVRSTPSSLSLVFGLIVLAAVALNVTGLRPRLTPRNSILAGVTGGFMGTATTIGGPPIALLYQGEAASRMRADLSAYFLVSMLFTAVALVNVDRLGWAELQRGLQLVPGTVVGFLVSSWLAPRLHREWTRRVVLTAAAGCALFLLSRAL
jgi:uncharacterized membrane protein YfcA